MGKNKSIDFRSDTTRHQAYSPSESGSEYQPPARTGNKAHMNQNMNLTSAFWAQLFKTNDVVSQNFDH